MSPVAPRNVNDVSYATMITRKIHFARQAQYLVMLEGESCCSTHCKKKFHMYIMRINHESHFAWQVQYLVILEDGFCCSAHCK